MSNNPAHSEGAGKDSTFKKKAEAKKNGSKSKSKSKDQGMQDVFASNLPTDVLLTAEQSSSNEVSQSNLSTEKRDENSIFFGISRKPMSQIDKAYNSESIKLHNSYNERTSTNMDPLRQAPDPNKTGDGYAQLLGESMMHFEKRAFGP